MRKKKLFTPGPCEIPQEVFQAMNSIEHHRTTQFQENIIEVQKDLKYIFQTKQPVITLASTGTGAMEAAICNLFKKEDVVLVVQAGKFGQRWEEISKVYGLEVLSLNIEWGKAVTVDQIKEVLEKHPSISAVLIQASETSTGAMHPIKEIAPYLKNKTETLFVVDAISALLTMPLNMDEWGIDVLIAGSQKGFMLPPGLSFIALSEAAWKKTESSNFPKYYFNLQLEKKCLEEKNTTAYTTPVTLILGLKEVLKIFRKQGLENIIHQYSVFSEAVRKAIELWGLTVFSESPTPGMTAVVGPENIKTSLIVNKLKEDFDITIAGGQAEFKDKIFRLSYMGDINAKDVVYLLESLQTVLLDLGAKIDTENALNEARKIILQ